MGINSIKDFESKYSKSIAKYIVKMYFSEGSDIEEFITDIKDFVALLSHKNSNTYLVFPEPKDISKFIDYIKDYNIICTNGYISGIEGKTCEHVLSYFDGVRDGSNVICVFDSSPEADVTFECVSSYLARERNCKVIRMPFGVSAFSPSKTDEYTFQVTLSEILKKV
ncbi:MAG: hypothetical protein QXS19_09355 [Candidatus Methanomethylicia archaeon]